MELSAAFRKLNANWFIVLIPIVLDSLALAAGLLFVQFPENVQPSFIVIYEMGLPSLAHILQTPVLISTYKFLAAAEPLTSVLAAAVLFFMLLQAFAQAAYIGALKRIAHAEQVSGTLLARDAGRHGFKFFLLSFLSLLVQMTIVTFLVFLLQTVGLFAAMMTLLILRVVLIYFEFTIVVHNGSLGYSLRQSYYYFKQQLLGTLKLGVLLLLVAGALSYFIHASFSLPFLIGWIAVYAYVLSLFQMALMLKLRSIVVM